MNENFVYTKTIYLDDSLDIYINNVPEDLPSGVYKIYDYSAIHNRSLPDNWYVTYDKFFTHEELVHLA